MNLRVFAHRAFAMGSIVAFIYGTALFGSTYLLPVYVQMGLNLSAAYVGIILLPAGYPGRHHRHRRAPGRPPAHAPAS